MLTHGDPLATCTHASEPVDGCSLNGDRRPGRDRDSRKICPAVGLLGPVDGIATLDQVSVFILESDKEVHNSKILR